MYLNVNNLFFQNQDQGLDLLSKNHNQNLFRDFDPHLILSNSCKDND